MKKQRPINLNLLNIRLPLSGIVSILHRLSGVLLFLSLPVVLVTLQHSLASENELNNIINTIRNSSILKLFILLVSWGFVHHFVAGIRFLLLDIHWGISLSRSRLSAKLVLGFSVLSLLGIGVWLW